MGLGELAVSMQSGYTFGALGCPLWVDKYCDAYRATNVLSASQTNHHPKRLQKNDYQA
jgi:hypothetical protein